MPDQHSECPVESLSEDDLEPETSDYRFVHLTATAPEHRFRYYDANHRLVYVGPYDSLPMSCHDALRDLGYDVCRVPAGLDADTVVDLLRDRFDHEISRSEETIYVTSLANPSEDVDNQLVGRGVHTALARYGYRSAIAHTMRGGKLRSVFEPMEKRETYQ